MTARWQVQVQCDNCKQRSGAVDADPHTGYGRTLRKLRELLKAKGWTSSTTHRHRDHCPACSQQRHA